MTRPYSRTAVVAEELLSAIEAEFRRSFGEFVRPLDTRPRCEECQRLLTEEESLFCCACLRDGRSSCRVCEAWVSHGAAYCGGCGAGVPVREVPR